MSAQPEPVLPSATGLDPDGPAVRKLRSRVTNVWGLRAFMFAKLPLALVAGLRVRSLDADHCVVTDTAATVRSG